MGQLTFRTASDITQLERDYQKLQRENVKLKDRISDVKVESKIGQKQATSMLSSMSNMAKQGANEMRGMISQHFTLGNAASGAVGIYKDWRAEVEKLGQEHSKFTENLVRELTSAGDLLQGPMIQQRLESMPGATREQATEAFAGVALGGPSLALERRLDIAEHIARQAPTGTDLRGLGEFAGELGDMLPQKTADDLADLATKLQAAAGGDAGKLASPSFLRAVQLMQSAGVKPEESLAMGMQALGANLRPDVLGDVADKITDRTLEKKPGADAFNRFVEAPAKQRLDMLFQDPAVREEVLGQQDMRFGLLNRDAIAAQARELEAAQRDNFALGQLTSLGKFNAGKEALQRQLTSVEKDVETRFIAAQEAQAQRAVDFVMGKTADEPPWRQFRAHTGATWIQDFPILGHQFGGPENTAGRIIENAVDRGFLTKEEGRTFQGREKELTELIELQREQSRRGEATQKALEEQTRLLRELKEVSQHNGNAMVSASRSASAAAQRGAQRE